MSKGQSTLDYIEECLKEPDPPSAFVRKMRGLSPGEPVSREDRNTAKTWMFAAVYSSDRFFVDNGEEDNDV